MPDACTRDRPSHKIDLGASKTYARRECTWVPGNDGTDHRDGTLGIALSKAAGDGGGWECDDYAVEERTRVEGHRSGRVFVVVNLDDDRGEGVYEVFLADRVVVVDGVPTYPDDRCECPAGRCKRKCKHVESIRAIVAADLYHGGQG